jgi:hypothetical protein
VIDKVIGVPGTQSSGLIKRQQEAHKAFATAESMLGKAFNRPISLHRPGFSNMPGTWFIRLSSFFNSTSIALSVKVVPICYHSSPSSD